MGYGANLGGMTPGVPMMPQMMGQLNKMTKMGPGASLNPSFSNLGLLMAETQKEEETAQQFA